MLAKEWRQGNAIFCQAARLSQPLARLATGEVHRGLRTTSTVAVQRLRVLLYSPRSSRLCAVQRHASLIAAWPRCAVSPNCIRQSVGGRPDPGTFKPLRIANPRYGRLKII